MNKTEIIKELLETEEITNKLCNGKIKNHWKKQQLKQYAKMEIKELEVVLNDLKYFIEKHQVVDKKEEPQKEEVLKNMIEEDLEKKGEITFETKEELIKELTQEKKEIPIYVIYEYATKRSLKPITTTAYINSKDTHWALKAKGSTILKINYELVDIKSGLFFLAIKNSYSHITEKISEKLFMEKVISQNLYAEVSNW